MKQTKLRRREGGMKKWTVVGFHDNGQVWIDHVEAKTKTEAVLTAISHRREIAAVIEVFKGHIQGQLNNPDIMWEEALNKLREAGGDESSC